MYQNQGTPEVVGLDYKENGPAVPGAVGPPTTRLENSERAPLFSSLKAQTASQDIPHHMLSGEFRRVAHGW